MKKHLLYATLFLSIGACQKEKVTEDTTIPASNSTTVAAESSMSTINIAAIKSAGQSELVNLNLATKKQQLTPIPSYVMGSVLFIPNALSIGYAGADSAFHLVNLLTGKPVKDFPIPGDGVVSQTVVNTKSNTLIGWQHDNQEHFIVTFNLATGNVIAKNRIDGVNDINSCSHFYRQETNTYYIISGDQKLLSVDPDNGTLKKSVPLEWMLNNVAYDSKQHRIIGIYYSPETHKNNIVTLDAENGMVISNTELLEQNDYYGCVSEYDGITKSYLMVTANNELLFVDNTTGTIKKRFSLDFNITEFCFWR
ncbi:MAG: hypothetical protein V4651_00665 [Bacteroidota bacterium]